MWAIPVLSECGARDVTLQQHIASRLVQVEICLEGKVSRFFSGGLNELGQDGEDSLAHTVDGRMAGDHLQFWHVLSLPTPRRGRYVSNWDDASVWPWSAPVSPSYCTRPPSRSPVGCPSTGCGTPCRAFRRSANCG